MRCIICDKCGETIENPDGVRVLTLQRPVHQPMIPGLKRAFTPEEGLSAIWTKELCIKCAGEIEAAIQPQDP